MNFCPPYMQENSVLVKEVRIMRVREFIDWYGQILNYNIKLIQKTYQFINVVNGVIHSHKTANLFFSFDSVAKPVNWNAYIGLPDAITRQFT